MRKASTTDRKTRFRSLDDRKIEDEIWNCDLGNTLHLGIAPIVKRAFQLPISCCIIPLRSFMPPHNHLSPDAHDIVERERLIRARNYADQIRRNPMLVVCARREIDILLRTGNATLGQQLWSKVLDEDLDTILAFMTADQPEGRLLRSNNPFSSLIPSESIEQRRATWRRAKCDLSLKTT